MNPANPAKLEAIAYGVAALAGAFLIYEFFIKPTLAVSDAATKAAADASETIGEIVTDTTAAAQELTEGTFVTPANEIGIGAKTFWENPREGFVTAWNYWTTGDIHNADGSY